MLFTDCCSWCSQVASLHPSISTHIYPTVLLLCSLYYHHHLVPLWLYVLAFIALSRDSHKSWLMTHATFSHLFIAFANFFGGFLQKKIFFGLRLSCAPDVVPFYLFVNVLFFLGLLRLCKADYDSNCIPNFSLIFPNVGLSIIVLCQFALCYGNWNLNLSWFLLWVEILYNNINRHITNKEVGVVVETHYSPREDPDLILGENFSWESKLDYIQKGLISFPGNREEGYHWKTKKK